MDRENATVAIMDFLKNENKRVLLLKGYDNEAKITTVLSCLNREFNKGIIRTSSMSNISWHINRAFKKDIIPHNIKSTKIYSIGKMAVKINSYATNTKYNDEGNNKTFTVFFPVENVLKSEKRYKDFLIDLENTNSAKIILVTTNEWGIKDWDIEKYVDEIYFYAVENDNPQLMKNLRSNGGI